MWRVALVLLVGPSLVVAQASPGASRATARSGVPITGTMNSGDGERMLPMRMDDMPGPSVQLRDPMPGSATLTWNAVPGASGYLVYRNDLGQVTPAALSSGTTSFSHVTQTNDFRVIYQYRVVALYPNGHTGSGAQVPFQPPKPVNPIRFTAEVLDATAELKWDPVPGVHHYLLSGPGTGPNGTVIPGTESRHTVTNVPLGDHTWTLGSYYPPGNVSTNWKEWSTAKGKTPSDKYRVTLAGFRVNQPTYDDQLNRDGWSDEVHAAAFVQQVDRANAVLVDTGTVQSRTHGDARGYPERIAAGQANAGLTAGDVVPKGWDESAGRSPVAGSFPLRVWEGELMDGRDALVIRPTIWEVDGDNTAFQYWKRWVAGTDPRSLVANAPPRAISQVTGDSIISHVSQALTMRWGRKESYADPGRDRPVGMTQYKWRDLALVLTREAIETELGRTSGTRGTPGLLALQMVDTSRPDPVGESMRGDYTLYLRIERVR